MAPPLAEAVYRGHSGTHSVPLFPDNAAASLPPISPPSILALSSLHPIQRREASRGQERATADKSIDRTDGTVLGSGWTHYCFSMCDLCRSSSSSSSHFNSLPLPPFSLWPELHLHPPPLRWSAGLSTCLLPPSNAASFPFLLWSPFTCFLLLFAHSKPSPPAAFFYWIIRFSCLSQQRFI